MRGGSPAYDYHVTEGFLNQPSTNLSSMPLTIHESQPFEHYVNLYKVSGGGRKTKRKSKPKKKSKSKRRYRK